MTHAIHLFGCSSPALRDHILTMMGHALDQHSGKVKSIDVRLHDENGPKGGVDRRVHAVVHLMRGEPVVIEQKGEDAYATIAKTADRVKQAVGRRLGKLVRSGRRRSR